MSQKFEIGMRVQVIGVNHPEWNHEIGKIGIVDGLYINNFGFACAYLEGEKDYDQEDGTRLGYRLEHLRPIPDDTAFDTFMGEVFKPVDIGVKSGEKA